jgi:hypothetical protein
LFTFGDEFRNLLWSSSRNPEHPTVSDSAGVAPKKEYSWDKKRKEMDLSKFTIENVVAGEVGRMPGEIGGILGYL